MVLIDSTVRKVTVARINEDTPYLTSVVDQAQCLPHAIHDLVIGNVPGARAPDDLSHSRARAASFFVCVCVCVCVCVGGGS